MTENDRLTGKRDGQNVIPLRQDGKTKWSLASAGMGDASTQFLYGTHADKLADYEAIGTVEKIKEELDRLRNDNECQGLYFTLEERKALAKQSRELSEYKGIGTIEEFKVLKEKAEVKKPIPLDKWGEYHECPVCGKCAENSYGCKYLYCPNCGCKYDWSE